MEKYYFHVGSLSGYVYEEGECWPLIQPRSFENKFRIEVEEQLECFRKQYRLCEYSRITSLFVAKTQEDAKYWARRKKWHGVDCYLYTLGYSGKVSWHNAEYYDRFAEIYRNENYTYPEIQTLEQAAELYWREVENNEECTCCEGLIIGTPIIKKREKIYIP